MKPCNSCACILSNKNKPSAEGQNWYSQENIDRIWAGIRKQGEFLICHSTDKDAKDYGGSDKIKGGKETACVGSALYVYMHIKIYESLDHKFGKYRNAVGHKVAMEQRAMLSCAIDMARGGTLFGTMKIPTEIDGDLDQFVYPTGFDKTVALFKQLVS